VRETARAAASSLLVLAVGVLLLLALPRLLDLHALINATIFASLAILALSLAFVWGFAGILSFGQAAFFGMGGYTYAVAGINLGDTTGAVALGILVPALFAALLGYFMFWGRISDVYLGVITLTVSLILFRLLNGTAGDAWRIGDAPLGGFNGIPQTPVINWPGRPGEALTPDGVFYLAMALVLLVYFGCRALLASRFGRVMVAIRENERRAELLGYDARRYKLGAFAIGGGIAGLAGILFANCVFVSPTMFSLNYSAQIIIWVIVGGVGTLLGPLAGCVLVQLVTTSLGSAGWLNANLMLGLILIGFVVLAPSGLAPLPVTAARSLRRLFPGARA
jgi:ABC-type branched-subunit amino acid transport system permease subunit